MQEEKSFKIIQEGITYPQGIKAAGIRCGIRFNKKDLALIYSEKIADAWGTFTTNKFKAAPLMVPRKIYLFREVNCKRC